MVAFGGEGWHYFAPGIGELGEAVQEEDEGVFGGAGGEEVVG